MPNLSDERWVTWVEPFGRLSDPVYMFLPVKTAIAAAKLSAKQKFVVYGTDEAALDDFMVCHWATFCEKPTEGFV